MILEEKYFGKSSDITLKDEELEELIKDNPAGQEREQTPLILIRRKNRNIDRF